MQIILLENENISGPVSVRTDIIDMENMPAFTALLNLLDIQGSSPQISVQFRTSDDLETWSNVGSAMTRSTAGQSAPDFFDIANKPYSRWVQAVAGSVARSD